MTIWAGEIKELDKLYLSFRGHIPEILKEMEQLVKTEDPNVVMLYSRRCLEVIITDLCESELNRPRKTEPLKGIIDKLNSEEKVPSHIITSMISLNSMANYGAHPKDFDPEQVKPVLNNLAIIIKWYLKFKDFKIVSKTDPIEGTHGSQAVKQYARTTKKPLRDAKNSKKKYRLMLFGFLAVAVIFILIRALLISRELKESLFYMSIDAYKTVVIGDQVWMAENLKTTLLNDGTPIQMEKSNKKWETQTIPSYSWYDHDKKKLGATYGALYNWYAVNTGKLCPTGWHVPTSEEWRILITFLGDSIDWIESGDSIILIPQVAGKMLKEAGNEHWADCDTIFSSDTYGFRALPGGNRNVYGPFWGIGEEGCWWSSSEDDSDDAKNVEMYFNNDGVTEIQQYKQFGMSVRCIRDQPPGTK